MMIDQAPNTSIDTQKPASPDGPSSPSQAPHSTTKLAQSLEPLPQDDEEIEAASEDEDSAYGTSLHSGSTSIRSSILSGIVEKGRRYQASRDNTINIPSDEKQFASMEAGHMALTILESQQSNPFFRSTLSPDAQHILDLGTGQGGWAIDVADRFPNLTVHGVDLYPPPQKWVPPNCILEVDDITKPWTWDHKFDLVHIRMLCGALSTEEWKRLYKQAYANLAPGGWIEHYDSVIDIRCDDGSLPADSLLAKFGAQMDVCLAKTGNTIKVSEMMRSGIEEAGFINVQERDYKVPFGGWAKHPIYREAGECKMVEFKDGLDGWLTWALTKYGAPEPWSEEEVIVYCAKFRQELDMKYHIYQPQKRVWAQKPYDAEVGNGTA